MRTAVHVLTVLLALACLDPRRSAADANSSSIGKIYDTGASLGFAEFFASLVDWSKAGASTQGDFDRMNQSLKLAAESFPGTKHVVAEFPVAPPPPAIKQVGKDTARPHTLVSGWRKGLYDSFNANSSYGDYYDLGAALAIAEGQALVATWLPASVALSKAALDTAVVRAGRLVGRGDVKLDLTALKALQAEVGRGEVKTANARIRAVREEFAKVIYASARPGTSTMSKPAMKLPAAPPPK